MPAIIIPRRHLTQPQGRLVVDFYSSFSQGLAAAFDLRTGAPLDVLCDQFSDYQGLSYPTDVGPGLYRDANPTATNDRKILQAGPISIVAVCNPVAELVSSCVFTDRPAAGGIQHSLFINAIPNGATSSGTVSYGYLGTEFSAINAISGKMDVYGMSLFGSADGAIYVSGARRSTTVNGSGFQNPSSPKLCVGWHANSGRLRATMPFLALWNRALSNDEHAEIAGNPWQLFRADPVRFYSLPSGPITLNSLTVSNITSSGARFTVGLTR